MSVDVVAVGARTPVGRTAESSAAAVRAGVSRLAEYPFIDPRGEPIVVAADPCLEPRAEGCARLLPMLESVLLEIQDRLIPGVRLRLLLALPEARPGFSEDDAAHLTQLAGSWLNARAPGAEVAIAGRGHAGAIRAVERALQACAQSRDALVLVAGVDSYHHTETFAWLERGRRLAGPGVRGGFVPGEGAGCLALASTELRRRLRLPQLAVVRAASTAQEARLRDSETGSFGEGMTQALEGVLAGLDPTREGIDALYTDLNGERYRSETWGFVALRAPPVWRSAGYQAPSDCWGDVGAAFGALAAVLAVQAFSRGYARGPRALVMAGSDGGLRGAMLLESPHASTKI